jgi:hypothetical protein
MVRQNLSPVSFDEVKHLPLSHIVPWIRCVRNHEVDCFFLITTELDGTRGGFPGLFPFAQIVCMRNILNSTISAIGVLVSRTPQSESANSFKKAT